MIIKIDDSLLDELKKNNNNKQKMLYIFEKIAHSIICGKHLIIANRDILDYLSKNIELSCHARAAFKKTLNKLPYYGVMLKNSEAARLIFKSQPDDNQNFIENHIINLFNIAQENIGKYLKTSSLVLEDQDDMYIYNEILNSFSGNIRLCYKIIHGGGERTHEVCKSNLVQNFFTFSICDSDKKTPFCGLGDTSKKAMDFFKKNYLSGNIHVLNCHEVENLLPPKFMLFMLLHARPEQKPPIEFVIESMKVQEDACLYYDYKEGHKFQQIYIDNGNIKKFWEKLYNDTSIIQIKSRIQEYENNKLKKSDLVCSKSSTLLSSLKHKLKNGELSIPYNDFQIDESLKSTIDSLVIFFRTWFIASKPISI